MFNWLQPFVTRLYVDEGLIKEIQDFFATTPKMLKDSGREATRLYGEGLEKSQDSSQVASIFRCRTLSREGD
jgi:hypothetical protein